MPSGLLLVFSTLLAVALVAAAPITGPTSELNGLTTANRVPTYFILLYLVCLVPALAAIALFLEAYILEWRLRRAQYRRLYKSCGLEWRTGRPHTSVHVELTAHIAESPLSRTGKAVASYEAIRRQRISHARDELAAGGLSYPVEGSARVSTPGKAHLPSRGVSVIQVRLPQVAGAIPPVRYHLPSGMRETPAAASLPPVQVLDAPRRPRTRTRKPAIMPANEPIRVLVSRTAHAAVLPAPSASSYVNSLNSSSIHIGTTFREPMRGRNPRKHVVRDYKANAQFLLPPLVE